MRGPPATPEEKRDIDKLIAQLSEVCNREIGAIIERENLESLKKFDVLVQTVILLFICDDDVAEEVMSRIKEKEDKNLTYFS